MITIRDILKLITRQLITSQLRNRRLRTRAGIFCLIAFILALAAHLDYPWRIFVPGSARSGAIIQNSVPVATVSAASFLGSPSTIAKNSIVAAFGTQLATGVQGATPGQSLPTTLLSTTVTVNDTVAPLFFVSPNQINYLVPPNIADGDAQVVVTMTAANGDQILSSGQMKISSFTPAIFTAAVSGSGAPAAVTGRINSNGQFVFDPALPVEPDPVNPGQFLPAPIDVGTPELPAFLILFCTGSVNAPAGSVKAVIGGVEVPVSPVPAPGFFGLDQINLPIPIELKGRGIVDLSIVANGVSSNTVIVNMAGNAGSGLSIANFSVTDGATAGQTITINGAGFSTTPNQNLVRFGAAQGQVIASTPTQLTVIVPFNAESGQVMVQTPQAETRSSSLFMVRTSISGLVQSTGTATSPPAPLEGVTIRVVGRNVSVQTNPQGTFVIPDLAPGLEQVEIDGGSTGIDPPYPLVTLKAVILPNRDNQFPQPISMQQIIGGSGDVGGGAGFAGDDQSSPISGRVFEALKQNSETVETSRQQPSLNGQLTPAKSVVISHRGVTLEIPLGTSVRFPDGKSNGQLQLTVLEGTRLPGIKLPAGVYSSNIAQITPLGTDLSPGGTLSFPNPDSARLLPGAKVDLYRFDPRAGSFIKRGTATVTPDRARVVSDGRLVDLGSFWLAASPTGVTTVTGRVIDPSGAPVAGAQVTANGRSDTTDQNGGFSIGDVATSGIGRITAEAVLPRQYGVSPRGTAAPTDAIAGGTTKVGPIMLSNINQIGLALSPFAINFTSNLLAARIDVTLTQLTPANGLSVTLSVDKPEVVSVPANLIIPGGRTTASFNVTRVGPGVASISARATVNGVALESKAVVTVGRPAPRLIGVSPASAPAGAKITITGAGLSSNPRGNTVTFIRNRVILAVIDPVKNEIVLDTTSNQPALRVVVPDITPGAVQIVVATIDGATGVISDPSAPINFTVARADLTTPSLISVSPAQGIPRDQITITGSGFSAVATENLVTFRQGLIETTARVFRSSATQLFVEIPSVNISRGRAAITARRVLPTGGRGGQSNALDFTIIEEPKQAPKPTLTNIVNGITGGSSGRDGDLINVTGSGFGRNFFDVKNNGLGNDEPLISMLLFSQNNVLVNFSLPVSATGGSQLTAVIPTGLNAGQVQITTVTFDLESGLVSEESNIFDKFNISIGSLRRVTEDEPNDIFELATKVVLQTIVDGRAGKDDPSEFIAVLDNGDEVSLVDFFQFTLDKPTQITFTLTMAQTADLDLFVLRQTSPGVFEGDISATRRPGAPEQLGGPEVLILPAGEWFIAVGAFNGSGQYALELRQGASPSISFVAPNQFRIRQMALVERKKK